jgi:hypothetical protein
MNNWGDTLRLIIESLLGPLIAGLTIWWVGKKEIDKRIQNEAIRDLMTLRGDYSSPEFRRSLNKVSISFHGDNEIRKQIRDLYENINNPTNSESAINRKIVGLIDQSFPEQKQTPTSTSVPHEVLDRESNSEKATNKKPQVSNAKKTKK